VVFEDGLTKIYKRSTRSMAATKIRLLVLFLAFAECPLE
jgi:hypothetical protein